MAMPTMTGAIEDDSDDEGESSGLVAASLSLFPAPPSPCAVVAPPFLLSPLHYTLGIPKML